MIGTSATAGAAGPTRWSQAARREQARGTGHSVPSKRYTGYGTDGRLYMMEDELQPCIECNEVNAKVPDDVPTLDLGAGDQNAQ
ncbi:unnamed protein product [Colias eurytheme]|nr:unnamed protein product [Colias eurytheme]